MNWNWHEFSRMFYPNDSKQAALFVANYNRIILEEEIQKLVRTVLQSERDKLSDSQKAATIDDFLNELPTLIAKEMFMKLATTTISDKHWH